MVLGGIIPPFTGRTAERKAAGRVAGINCPVPILNRNQRCRPRRCYRLAWRFEGMRQITAGRVEFKDALSTAMTPHEAKLQPCGWQLWATVFVVGVSLVVASPYIGIRRLMRAWRKWRLDDHTPSASGYDLLPSREERRNVVTHWRSGF